MLSGLIIAKVSRIFLKHNVVQLNQDLAIKLFFKKL